MAQLTVNEKKSLIKTAPKGTVKIFEFEDNGQDFLYWYVDGDGIVLDATPFQGSVWRNCRVAQHVMEMGLAGDQMDYWFKDGSQCSLKHKIKEIINLNKENGSGN